METIRIFSPATVANVGCGFDVLGFCLDKVGDEMVVKKSQRKGIFITKIEGFELPYDVHENVAGVSALCMYACLLYTSPSPRDLSTSRMPSSA